jgi:hypothetical protein
VRRLVFLLVACAPQPASRTIEPTIEPTPGGQPTGDDDSFVLSRGTKAQTPTTRADFPIHLQDNWWPFRAEYLAISPAEAQARDEKITNRAPPDGFWDEQTALEAVSLWSALCNECHGGRRSLKDSLSMPPPPPGWGVGEGLFFGRRRPYVTIFDTITAGGPTRDGVPSEMPKWGGKIAREQIWSLIYFIEYQSGGVIGYFPPSLYPRKPTDN